MKLQTPILRKKWKLLPAADTEKIQSLSSAINVNAILSAVLVQRGIETFDQARDFFRPSLSKLHDPFLMKDMDKAVIRLKYALEQGQHVRFYGDYDVDGTTATSLCYNILKQISHQGKVSYYLPDRYSEGYGLSLAGVKDAVQSKVDLLITLDCGIRGGKLIAECNRHQIDVIVCDHHLPGEKLPPAMAILDPKQLNCDYPYPELSGCGVGFKLMQALLESLNEDPTILYQQLDLLAVSICADIVPIDGENRIFTHHGMQRLANQPNPGLHALARQAGITPPYSVSDLVFGIAPRINAAGRMAHAKEVVRLLTEPDSPEIQEFAKNIQAHNEDRKGQDLGITEEALQMLGKDADQNRYSTVLFKEGWHKGVVGIVASRCIEKYYRPTIILSLEQGVATGSARSVKGFNIYDAIASCSEWLEKFGGHDHAAGLSVKEENLDQFKAAFERAVAARIKEEHLQPEIQIEHEVRLSQLTGKFYHILRQFEPFGPANFNPTFMATSLKCTHPPQLMKEKHLRFFVSQPPETTTFKAMAFNMAELLQDIDFSQPIDLAFHLELNEFRGEKTLFLRVKDIRQSKENDITGKKPFQAI